MKQRQNGLSMVEVLVGISLVAVLTSLAVTYGPKVQQTPDESSIIGNLTATLESIHSQAVGERRLTLVTATADALVIQAQGANEVERFPGVTLSGSVTIQADGTSEGAIQALMPACRHLHLLPSGVSVNESCTDN